MANVIVNKSYINKTLGIKGLQIFKTKNEQKVKKIVANQNKKLLKDFLSHEISKEINAGPNSNNTSGTLNGKGNLFSFLGFEKGDKPINELAEFLSNSIQIEKISISKSSYSVSIQITIPEIKDLNNIAELPWINKGLVNAIEKGVSGLGAYLYSQKGFDQSRSGRAIQLKKDIKRGSLKPQTYLSEIIENISKKLIEEIKKNI